MKSKQRLVAVLLGIAAMIAISIAAATGYLDAHGRQGSGSQWLDAVIPAGHHYGWRNQANYSPGLLWNENGDDCYAAPKCDDDDCPAIWSDDDDDCEPAYNSHSSNSGYNGAYNAPHKNNGTNRPMLALVLLLQQSVR